ncbi:MAG: DUF3747 domain-containing protein [Leptolyngbya sp. SIO1D8]|nr:DUF3747 domain-containing protein [Leptolyngbya sp. SIO1D8]
MKSTKALKLVAIAAATATIGILGNTATAWAQAQFSNREVDQSRFLSVSAPGSVFIPHSLYLIEQRSDARPCFEVSGSDPGEVNPLWTTFDFTQGNVCGRSSDSNGYSIRINGEDLGSTYRLQIKESEGELVLLGVSATSPDLLIGRTGGISNNGFTEIKLQQGWRITQRVFEGRALGHFYYTNDATLAELTAGGEVVVTPPTTPPVTTPQEPVPFPDVRGDIYATEIARAVEIGFVAGFQDGTFKPTQPVTREEAASMVVEALQAFLPAGEQLPMTQVTSDPFPDVSATRWSAQKIALLRQYEIVAGDPDGSYRPTSTITRAELMAMLRKTAIAFRTQVGLTATLEPTQDTFAFSDTSGHWAQSVITTMSGYCGVATPYNERGSAFQPNSQSLRNYTAAAIERLFDCGSTPE